MKTDELKKLVAVFDNRDTHDTESLKRLGGVFYKIGEDDWCDLPTRSFKRIGPDSWTVQN